MSATTPFEDRVVCPGCNRNVTIKGSRYEHHSVTGRYTRDGNRCRFSEQRIPITGHTDDAYVMRARLVVDLAEQVQDADPTVVWDYLTALPADELQRLTMIALAGIRVDQTVDQIFAWVKLLPVAQLQETA